MNSHSHDAARVALVTGGGSGIGRAVCLALAGEGRSVAVADLNSATAAETAAMVSGSGGKAIAVAVDVTSDHSVSEGYLRTIEDLGPVGILVNCAGWDALVPFLDTDETFWDKVIDINFKGMLRTTHRCLPAMVEQGWGRLVNISSDAALVGSSLEAVYSGAKGGVVSFTKTIAREMAQSGITANVVCPGPTQTPLLEGMVAASDDGEKVIGAMARAVPMKRLGQPRDVASAVAYFASEEAAFVTGQTLSVSGGLTMA
ncbi:MAG: SDR family oxidoreductase [Acidimicrobiales bacterium]|nr:SDR family oxidoreductase [Acidimicrobiales bacterium]